MPGFFEGLYSVVGPRIEELHSLQDQQRPEKAQPLYKVLYDPDASEVQFDQAHDALKALYKGSKESVAQIDRAYQVQKAFRAHQRMMQQQPSGGSQPQQQPGGLPTPEQAQSGGLMNMQQAGAPPATQANDQIPADAGPKTREAMQNMTPERRTMLNKLLSGLKNYGQGVGDRLGINVEGKIGQMRQGLQQADMAAAAAQPAPDAAYRQKIALIRGALERKEITQEDAEALMREAVYASTIGKPPATPSESIGDIPGTSLPPDAKDAFGADIDRSGTVTYRKGKDGKLYPQGAKQSAAARWESGLIDGEYLKKKIEAGEKLKSIDGGLLKPEDIKTGMMARRLGTPPNVMYALEDPRMTTTNFANTVWLRNPYDLNAPMIPLGPHTVGMVSTHQTMMYDTAKNKWQMVTMTSTRTPQGAQTQWRFADGRPAPTPDFSEGMVPTAQPEPSPNPTQLTPPTPTQTAPAPGQTQRGAAAKPAPSSKGQAVASAAQKAAGVSDLPSPGLIPQGQVTRASKTIGPIREATVVVVGDPESAAPALGDFSGLLRKPVSEQKAMGKAFNTFFGGLENRTGESRVAFGMEGVTVGLGQLSDWLQNLIHLPTAVAGQIADMQRQTLADLGKNDDWRDYFDTLITAYGTVMGLRSVTGNPATMATATSLEREIPVIGWNVFNEHQYADKMLQFIREVRNARESVMIPKEAFPPSMMANLDAQEKKFKALYDRTKNQDSNATSFGGAPANRKDIQQGPASKNAGDDYIDKLRREGTIK